MTRLPLATCSPDLPVGVPDDRALDDAEFLRDERTAGFSGVHERPRARGAPSRGRSDDRVRLLAPGCARGRRRRSCRCRRVPLTFGRCGDLRSLAPRFAYGGFGHWHPFRGGPGRLRGRRTRTLVAGQVGACALQLLESLGRLFDKAHRSPSRDAGHQQGRTPARRRTTRPDRRVRRRRASGRGASCAPSRRLEQHDSVPRNGRSATARSARPSWNVGRSSLATKLASSPAPSAATKAIAEQHQTRLGGNGLRRHARRVDDPEQRGLRLLHIGAHRRCLAPREQVTVGLLLYVVVAVELRELGLDLRHEPRRRLQLPRTALRTTRASRTATRRSLPRRRARRASSGTPDSARTTCAGLADRGLAARDPEARPGAAPRSSTSTRLVPTTSGCWSV